MGPEPNNQPGPLSGGRLLRASRFQTYDDVHNEHGSRVGVESEARKRGELIALRAASGISVEPERTGI
jgi:hypothetical protein